MTTDFIQIFIGNIISKYRFTVIVKGMQSQNLKYITLDCNRTSSYL
jgi:hypothetical protein